MTTTEAATSGRRRKATAMEFTILYGWHAIVSGAFIVAYLSGDEETYGMHQFSGYLLLAALCLRALAALLAPQGSPLRLRRPEFAPLIAWGKTLLARPEPLPRRPLFASIAAALLAGLAAAAVTGAIADFVPFIEHVHEGLAEFALWIVLGHIAFVVALTAGTKLWRRFRTALVPTLAEKRG
jgi:cytochrome b